MKWIKYKVYVPPVVETDRDGNERVLEESWFQENSRLVTDSTQEAHLADILRVAYNGEYEIIDDGQPEPEPEPTQLDRVEAQATYTAMMTDTLLEE